MKTGDILYVKMSNSQEQSAKKDPYKIDYYQKNKDGKYWFHSITNEEWAKKPQAWKTAVQGSIADYFGCMVMTGNIINSGEYKMYCDAANTFADSH